LRKAEASVISGTLLATAFTNAFWSSLFNLKKSFANGQTPLLYVNSSIDFSKDIAEEYRKDRQMRVWLSLYLNGLAFT
jgi:hypothetical protein